MNDRIMIELIDCEVGQQLCLEDVLLVGSADYTAIGRPQVNNARVYVTVEEQTQTAKVLYYKSKRRKGYQRSGGHRQDVILLRVDRIEHDLKESDFGENGDELASTDITLMQRPSGNENFIL